MRIAPGVQPDVAAKTFQQIFGVDGVAHADHYHRGFPERQKEIHRVFATLNG
jgi:hypothetical protein